MPKRDRQCVACGAAITSRYRQVRFCSPKCYYGSERGKIRKQKQLGLRFRKTMPGRMVPCIVCGKEYLRYASAKDRKCCSFKCGVTLLTRQVPVTCAHCGREFTRAQALVRRAKRVFCDKACAWNFNRGSNAHNWRGGQPRHYRGPDWRQQSREARARDKHTCQVCGKPQEKGQRLSVDHIIPYRIVKENALINLISICRAPCHAVKTQGAEKCFLRGDMLGFVQKLREAQWPMERVQTAISYWAAK